MYSDDMSSRPLRCGDLDDTKHGRRLRNAVGHARQLDRDLEEASRAVEQRRRTEVDVACRDGTQPFRDARLQLLDLLRPSRREIFGDGDATDGSSLTDTRHAHARLPVAFARTGALIDTEGHGEAVRVGVAILTARLRRGVMWLVHAESGAW